MKDERMLQAEGFLVGPVDLVAQADWGPARLWAEEDGRVHFELLLDVAGRPDDDMEPLLQRVEPALQAAVAAACGAAVTAHLSGWSYPRGELRNVVSSVVSRSAVLAGLDITTGAGERGLRVFQAVLEGEDRRLAELYEVYLLGVQAAQTIAPVVGLWAFSTVLEEEAPPKKRNLNHVPKLADELRAKGYTVAGNPQRNVDVIRAAALHPTPKSPLPTPQEVSWFRELAGAYLLDRASRDRDHQAPISAAATN